MESGSAVSLIRNSDNGVTAEVNEDSVTDEKLINVITPQLTIIEAEDDSVHKAICSRCRTISSSLLPNSMRSWNQALYSHECNGYSEGCRFDESIQQFYSVPEDDVPLLGVSLLI